MEFHKNLILGISFQICKSSSLPGVPKRAMSSSHIALCPLELIARGWCSPTASEFPFCNMCRKKEFRKTKRKTIYVRTLMLQLMIQVSPLPLLQKRNAARMELDSSKGLSVFPAKSAKTKSLFDIILGVVFAVKINQEMRIGRCCHKLSSEK